MAILQGTPTHRATVAVYAGRMVEPDELVRYDGEPSWKFEPLDPDAAARWGETHADPDRAEAENFRTRRKA